MSMTELENKILEFTERVSRYGYAVSISAKQGSMNTSIQSTFIPIEELTNGGSFYKFLKEVIDNMNVNQLTVIAKQRNGFSAYKNPQTFILDIPAISPHQNNNQASMKHVGSGLTGYPAQPVDPMNQVLNFKIEQQQLQIQELKPFKEKYEDEREKRFDIERELKLIEEKHELEKTKDEYNAKNSFAGVIGELKEPITAALSGFANMQSQPSGPALGGTPSSNSKINFLVELFNEMDQEIMNKLFEINTRAVFVPGIIPHVLESVQKNTSSINGKIAELNSQH